MLYTVWAKIPNYNSYIISIDGKIRSIDRKKGNRNIKGQSIKSFKTEAGYLRVSLTKDTGEIKKNNIHRLMCKTFIREHKPYEVSDHINNIKDDNRLENLRIISNSQNVKRSHLGNSKIQKDSASICNKKHNLTKEDYVKIRELYKVMTGTELTKKYNITRGQLQRIVYGKEPRWISI